MASVTASIDSIIEAWRFLKSLAGRKTSISSKGASGAGPSVFSILCNASRVAKSSSRDRPKTTLPKTLAAAWPNAQALTSCAKSATLPFSIVISTITADPHSGERFLTVASGFCSREGADSSVANARIREEYNFISSFSLDKVFPFS